MDAEVYTLQSHQYLTGGLGTQRCQEEFVPHIQLRSTGDSAHQRLLLLRRFRYEINSNTCPPMILKIWEILSSEVLKLKYSN